MSGAPIHDLIKPLSWLLGKWKGSGKGYYPTIEDFTYTEELEFFHVGQPMLQYSSYSYQSETNKPLHREIGFIRIKPGTKQVAFVVAHNNGVSEMAEGTYEKQEITAESHSIGRLSFGEDPKTMKLKRTYRLEGNTLHSVLDMETDITPMTEHLKAEYSRVQ